MAVTTSGIAPRCTERTAEILHDVTGLPPKEALEHLLKECGTVKGIARKTGLNRTTIYQAMAHFRITRDEYDHSVFMKDHMAQLSEQKRLERAQAAHDTIRGKPRPREQKLKTALAHERNGWRRLSMGEREVARLCQDHGLSLIPHMAVDIFNIDVALPELRVAIEVQGGHWHTAPRKAKQDAKKRVFLESQGWQIVEFWGSPSEIREAAAEWLSRHRH